MWKNIWNSSKYLRTFSLILKIRRLYKKVCNYITPGGTPYIRMIEMIVVFLGAVFGNLVFLGIVHAKSINNSKTGFC